MGASVAAGMRMTHASSAIRTFNRRQDLTMNLAGVGIRGKQLYITDGRKFRQNDLPLLAANVADFGARSAAESVRALSAWIIAEAAQQMGAKLASPQELYVAIAEGKVPRQFSIPAVNVRGNSLDTARALFAAARDQKVGALILEVARSETGYTNQLPREFASVIQAAAMIEGFTGPIFLQGDHIQLKAGAIAEGGSKAEKELEAHRALIRAFMAAGFGSIDLDMSPFERRTETELPFDVQQADNARLTAEKIRDVRALETELELPWTTLLGGETGEVGKMNTRREDLEAYSAGIVANMRRLGIDPSLGIRKIAVNDGTAHGGTPLPDGSVADVAIAWEVLKMAKDIGVQFGWAGPVQHGASTLPDNAFSHFVANGAVEVHLATGFQNILFDSGLYTLEGMQARVLQDCMASFSGERKEGQTDEQFVYKTRKKWLGPNKHEIWTMPQQVRAAVAQELYAKFVYLFQQLEVVDTVDLVAEHTTLHDLHRPYPAARTTTIVSLDTTDDGTLSD